MKNRCLWAIAAFLLYALAACSDDATDDLELTGSTLVFASDSRTISFGYEASDSVITFTAPASWKAEIESGVDWIFCSPATGKSGTATMKVSTTENTASSSRTGTFTVTSGTDAQTFTVVQPEYGGSNDLNDADTKEMDPADIEDYDKYYKPAEFANINMLKSTAKWSWYRCKQSEHFFVFWEEGFGDDPNATSVPSALRVDVDDLLVKAEQFFDTNINTLGMAVLGQGKSYLDIYKMQIYILYQEDWLATGSGYDNVIGALWVNPSTCQPVGSTIAHEIGHSFQYQTYCDKIYQGGTDDSLSGWRYGFGSNGSGGCAYWEQCAQWQSYQDYPEEQFTTYNFDEWINNHHRHFHHEWMRYASYWLQSYWVTKHGVEAYGELWRESVYPEDAIETYTRLYNGNDWQTTREELFDYAVRMATFDIDYKTITPYSSSYQGYYSTTLLKNSDGMYQPPYSQCPGATGFNVIPLTVPDGGGTVTVSFKGLEYGAALLSSDGGMTTAGDGVASKAVTNYNAVGGAENMGWRYGFVSYSGGTRKYSSVGKDKSGTLSFDCPANAEALYLVVQGSPETYDGFRLAWDEKEETDAQFPYSFSLEGTGVKGMIDVDTTKDPEDITIDLSRTYTLAEKTEYALESVDLIENGMAEKLCQAFVLNSGEFSAAVQTISSGSTGSPAEGKITFGITEPDGTVNYSYTANNGFYIAADGSVGSWGSGDPMWVEYTPDTFTLTLGHYPGKTAAGDSYSYKPTFTYIKDGKTYKAVINITVKFE